VYGSGGLDLERYINVIMDFNRAEELLGRLTDLVDLPLFEDSPRFVLSRTLSITSLHFAASVRMLCSENLVLGCASLLRSQFEALVRSVWALHGATDIQIENLSSLLNLDSQQSTKNIPMVNGMLNELEQFSQLKNLLIALKEFKTSSWLPLNSFVHSGIHAIHWTKHEAPDELFDQVFRASNGLAVLAFQNIALLTGQHGLQSKVIAITTSASYSGCVPADRTVP
jgi:hypothetical protein